MSLSKQFQTDKDALCDVPVERFINLARHVVAQALKDAVKGDEAAVQWIESDQSLFWAEACGVDQLWPPRLDRLNLSN